MPVPSSSGWSRRRGPTASSSSTEARPTRSGTTCSAARQRSRRSSVRVRRSSWSATATSRSRSLSRPTRSRAASPARAPSSTSRRADSHSDLWDDYFGSRFAHGTMFRRALEDGILDKGSVIQIGIRGQLYAEDDEDIARHYEVEIIRIEEALRLGPKELGNRCSRLSGPVYVSVDIDSVDPAFAPGTGTPAVGGFTSLDMLRLLRQLHRLRIVGADIVEVSPPYDVAGTTAYLAANLA